MSTTKKQIFFKNSDLSDVEKLIFGCLNVYEMYIFGCSSKKMLKKKKKELLNRMNYNKNFSYNKEIAYYCYRVNRNNNNYVINFNDFQIEKFNANNFTKMYIYFIRIFDIFIQFYGNHYSQFFTIFNNIIGIDFVLNDITISWIDFSKIAIYLILYQNYFVPSKKKVLILFLETLSIHSEIKNFNNNITTLYQKIKNNTDCQIMKSNIEKILNKTPIQMCVLKCNLNTKLIKILLNRGFEINGVLPVEDLSVQDLPRENQTINNNLPIILNYLPRAINNLARENNNLPREECVKYYNLCPPLFLSSITNYNCHKIFVENIKDINYQNNLGHTILHFIVLQKFYLKELNNAEKNYVGDYNEKNIVSYFNNFDLFTIMNGKKLIFRIYKKKNIDLNKRDIIGFTVLHYCVITPTIDLLEYLINNGADVNILTNSNKTALDLLFENNSNNKFNSNRELKNKSYQLLINNGAKLNKYLNCSIQEYMANYLFIP